MNISIETGIIIGITLILLPMIWKWQWATRRTKIIDKEIQGLRQRILVVTSNNIPGKEIRDTLGSVTGISSIAAAGGAEVTLAEKEAMLDIINRAISMGANALIDLKMTTSAYEQQGLEGIVSSVLYNKKMASKVIYNGTAVRI
ncbi:MAG TPA: hypothetical protein DCP24_00550 [Nitrospiraceae bacterium]|nr:MAG: hypothetical protein A2Z82_00870 [Nitrospirae bacterium GWA2_46_11]HAK87560.1 hypothetical protein [Nitrospiraceae bacterium]